MNDRFNNAVGPQVRSSKKGGGWAIPFLAILFMVGGLQAATQLFAYDIGYDPALGWHVQRIYPFWGILDWSYRWYAAYPAIFMRAGSLGVVVAGFGLLILAVAKMVMANSSKVNAYLHGSARWANREDIRAAGLIPFSPSLWKTISGKPTESSSGVYVGASVDKKGQQHYLKHSGPEHILCYAPPAQARVSV